MSDDRSDSGSGIYPFPNTPAIPAMQLTPLRIESDQREEQIWPERPGCGPRSADDPVTHLMPTVLIEVFDDHGLPKEIVWKQSSSGEIYPVALPHDPTKVHGPIDVPPYNPSVVPDIELL